MNVNRWKKYFSINTKYNQSGFDKVCMCGHPKYSHVLNSIFYGSCERYWYEDNWKYRTCGCPKYKRIRSKEAK